MTVAELSNFFCRRFAEKMKNFEIGAMVTQPEGFTAVADNEKVVLTLDSLPPLPKHCKSTNRFLVIFVFFFLGKTAQND